LRNALELPTKKSCRALCEEKKNLIMQLSGVFSGGRRKGSPSGPRQTFRGEYESSPELADKKHRFAFLRAPRKNLTS